MPEPDAIPSQEIVSRQLEQSTRAGLAGPAEFGQSPMWCFALAVEPERAMLGLHDKSVVLKLREPPRYHATARAEFCHSTAIGQERLVAAFRDSPLQADVERASAMRHGSPSATVERANEQRHERPVDRVRVPAHGAPRFSSMRRTAGHNSSNTSRTSRSLMAGSVTTEAKMVWRRASSGGRPCAPGQISLSDLSVAPTSRPSSGSPFTVSAVAGFLALREAFAPPLPWSRLRLDRGTVRRLRASSQRGTRAAAELLPGPLRVPARSWLKARPTHSRVQTD